MAIRRRGSRWAVEIYDPSAASRKRYVGTFATHREARDAERAAEGSVARLRGKRNDETVATFAARWLDLRPRQKEATNRAYREQVKPFLERHGERRLGDVDIELAYEWLREKRWTHGGIRAMFSDARRMGLVDANPFAGLRLRGSRGRKDLAPLTVGQADRLAECAGEVWSGEVALTMRVRTGARRAAAPGRRRPCGRAGAPHPVPAI